MKKRFMCTTLLCIMAIFTGCGGSQEEESAPKIKARQGEIGEALGTLAVTSPVIETDFETEAIPQTDILTDTTPEESGMMQTEIETLSEETRIEEILEETTEGQAESEEVEEVIGETPENQEMDFEVDESQSETMEEDEET